MRCRMTPCRRRATATGLPPSAAAEELRLGAAQRGYAVGRAEVRRRVSSMVWARPSR